ncbi:hypothetical protein [Leptothoe spongobia]|uniref:Uncharacterized protein n=1 Tax=Leptothoe spongobia TAU-MAC 1115 TaxID=1967444 RepID=A0A947DB63_9CYAN|nr:hypothetical protein [Leptothoe spongobia]MBT9314055.1 hypothetical protein [Leptothoe spongobia TAU-MAC 1115]
MIAIANNAMTTSRLDVFQIFLQDEDGQNILSIDDGSLRQALTIDIVNTSGKEIELQSIDGQPSLSNYHFCISFRPGTLLSSQDEDKTITLKETGEGWQMKPQGNTFYVLSTSPESTVINPGKRITLTLENIGAAPAGGSRGTRVEIKYDHLQYQGSTETISGNRLQYLNIVNQRGKKQIPLYVGFLGSNTILNDGTENELTLTIQSLPHHNASLTVLDSPEITSIGTTRWDGNIAKFIQEKLPNFGEAIKEIKQDPKISKASKRFFDLLKTSKDSKDSLQEFKEKSGKLNLKDTDKETILSILINNLGVVTQKDLNAILARLNELLYSTKPTAQELARINRKTKEIIQASENLKVIEHELNPHVSLSLKGLDQENTLDQAAKFTIYFDVVSKDSNPKNWALVDHTDADDVQVLIENRQDKWIFGGKEEQGITPRWSFICKQGWALKKDEREEILRLKINNLKTQLLAGYANLYVHYENIPGYWDGYITVPIHKGPLVYREKTVDSNKIGCVGIGTDEPQAKLHVKSSSGKDIAKFSSASGDAYILIESGSSDEAYLRLQNTTTGKNAWMVGMDDDEQFKIAYGSGTDITAGNSKITVTQAGDTAISGNLSVTSGKVGIGIASGTEQLKVKGDTAITGNLSVDTGSFGIDNKGEQWNLQVDSDGNLRFNANDLVDGSTRMIINDDNGNVGIGTNDPGTNKLKVQGDTEIAGELKVDGIIRSNVFRPSTTNDWEIALNGEHLEIREPEEDGKVWARFNDDSSLHLIGTPNLIVDGTLKIGNTVITENDLKTLKKFVDSELKVRIQSPQGYYIDNYANRNGGGDSARSIEFRSDKAPGTSLKLKIIG